MAADAARIRRWAAELAAKIQEETFMLGDYEIPSTPADWLQEATDVLAAELTRFAAEVERGGWVSVAERLPEKTGQYLVCKVDGMASVFITTYFAEQGMRAFHFADVTHWRPLPAPPEAAPQV